VSVLRPRLRKWYEETRVVLLNFAEGG